jgi:antitoxin component YwqK of YwqJK toxin-antitoxin module
MHSIKYRLFVNKIAITAGFLTLLASPLFGQDTIYFDSSRVKVEKENAVFFRTITPYKSKYQVEDYFASGQLKMKGFSLRKDSLIKDGYFEYYTSYGKQEMKVNYKDDIIDGPYELFYSNGSLKERGIYKSGLLSEKNTQYFQNGKLKREAEFIDGKYNGHMIYYNEEGTKIGEGNCIDDGWDGKWIRYDNNGDSLSELFYGKILTIEDIRVVFTSHKYIWQLLVSEETQDYKRFEIKCIAPITNKKNIISTPPIIRVSVSAKDDRFENLHKDFSNKKPLDITISDLSVQLIESYQVSYPSKNNKKNELFVLQLRKGGRVFAIEYILKESDDPNNKNIALDLIKSLKGY